MPTDLTTIGPKSRKQELFINSRAHITVFGGAAGSGKSHLGVMDFLKYIHHKRFRGLITRRTTPQLKGPGGIYDKARTLFSTLDPKVKWKDKDGKFIFSSGAEVYLKHFEHRDDQDNYQGSEVNLFLIDEGQQYEEGMIQYLMSRMRNPMCPEVMPHMKITCNPDADSFLRNWVEWYLIQDGLNAGRPDPEKDGVLRYFIVKDGKMRWGSSEEELKTQYGEKVRPLSFTFISANVHDNPVVMEINPDYVAWLEGLKPVEKERLLYGNWFAREQACGYFKREWCQFALYPPASVCKRVRAWDLAGTLPSEAYPNPDYTAGVRLSKKIAGGYCVEDVIRFRDRPHGVLERIKRTAIEDGQETIIIIPADPGAAGKAYAAQIVRDLAEMGYYARIKTTSTSKITRFNPFAAVAESGSIEVVKAEWNDDYFAELERFDGSRLIKDDMVDATGDAFLELARTHPLPNFTLPTMERVNPFRMR